MKRKRAHDEKAILKYERKDQLLPINDDEQMKTLEVWMNNLFVFFLLNLFI